MTQIVGLGTKHQSLPEPHVNRRFSYQDVVGVLTKPHYKVRIIVARHVIRDMPGMELLALVRANREIWKDKPWPHYVNWASKRLMKIICMSGGAGAIPWKVIGALRHGAAGNEGTPAFLNNPEFLAAAFEARVKRRKLLNQIQASHLSKKYWVGRKEAKQVDVERHAESMQRHKAEEHADGVTAKDFSDKPRTKQFLREEAEITARRDAWKVKHGYR
jgi:hypothetical protein